MDACFNDIYCLLKLRSINSSCFTRIRWGAQNGFTGAMPQLSTDSTSFRGNRRHRVNDVNSFE